MRWVVVPALVAWSALACLQLAGAAPVRAATLTVTTTTDELTSGDGLCSLREAVAAVNSPGTATDCGTASSTSNRIVLPASPTPYALSIGPSGADDNSSGDLNVTGTAPLTIRGAGQAATVIDASGLGDRVLSIAAGASVTLQNLEITGGHAPDGATEGPCLNGGDAGSAGAGGGVYNGGTLSLIGVGVAGNTAGAGGGGGGDSRVCSVAGHGGSGASGGGIYNAAKLTVSDSAILNNDAGAGGPGGNGVHCEFGVPCSHGGGGGGGGAGGGIYTAGSAAKLTLTKSTIAGNRGGNGGVGGDVGGSGAGGGGGGGISAVGGSLRVTNSTLEGNDAGGGGGGGGGTNFCKPQPDCTGEDGGNGAAGGAIATSGLQSTSFVRNATIANNAAGAGGAAGSFGSKGAPGNGGGLANSTALTLQNTIVASNNAHRAANCDPSSGVADGGHDLSYPGASCPGGNSNPALQALADYGGPTQTLALGSGSAAIDQVPATGAGCPETDQRGVTRPQGPACDIGAFELASPTVTITTPARRAHYQQGQNVLAAYTCSEGGITSPIQSCTGTVADGQPIDTSSPGTYSFTVTATDKAGDTTTKTRHYTVP